MIHSAHEFLLHDDFYDDDGAADQPEASVVDAHLFPSPRLIDVRHSLSLLMDYCQSRHILREPELKAFGAFDPEFVHTEIERRLALPKFMHFQSDYVEIAAANPSKRTLTWYRGLLNHQSRDGLYVLLHAGSGLLPAGEVFDHGVRGAASAPIALRRDWASTLAKTRDPRFFAWLESNLSEPITSTWGWSAAVAGVEWPQLQEWLARGRPLSLVAIDALHRYFVWPPKPLIVVPGSLRSEQARLDIGAVLRDYAMRDPVHRVHSLTASILAAMESRKNSQS
ncbi:MAG: hypothetical protein AABZ53_11740 [Planctomycetota bacterium]